MKMLKSVTDLYCVGVAVNLGAFLSPAAEETALDDFDDERCCFFLTHLRIKPSSDDNQPKN